MGTYRNKSFTADAVSTCAGANSTFGDWSANKGSSYSPYSYYAVSYRFPTGPVYSISSVAIKVELTCDDNIFAGVYIGTRDLTGYTGRVFDRYATFVQNLELSGEGRTTTSTVNYSGELVNDGYFYVTLKLQGASSSARCTGITATATYYDISIDSISPQSVQTHIGQTQTITIEAINLGAGDTYYADGTVSLAANNKTIATCKISDGTIVDYIIEGRKDRYTFQCTTDWFKTIASTSDTITVTVKIADNSTYKRTATSTFQIIKPALSISAQYSEVTVSNDSEYNYINVDGQYSGKFSVVIKHGNTPDSPYQIDSNSSFRVNVPKDWFYDQSFDNTNVTVTVTDKLYRVRQTTFKALLPTMTVETDYDSYESPASIRAWAGDNVGTTSIYYKIGNSENYIGSDSVSFTLYNDLFANTKSNQISVQVIARSDHYKQSSTKTITLNAGPSAYPSISNIVLNPSNPIAMPSSYRWVSGYSRARVASATVTWGAAGSGNGATVVLSGVGTQVGLETKDEKYYYGETTSTITGAFTITITVTDSMGRSGTSSVYVSASNITTLPAITIDPSSRTVEAGESVTLGITGFVTKYDIDFKNLNTLLDRDTEQTAETYTEDCAPEWFQRASITSKSMNVTVTVTDVLGRKATLSLTVTLPELRLELNPSTYVVIGNDLTIKIKGRSGQTVNMAFKATNGTAEVDLPTLTVNADQKVVTCQKTWFTQNSAFDNEKELTIQISATAGTQATTANFKLKYPDLAVRTDKSSVVAGNEITLTFDNREGERVWIDLFSGTVDLQTQYTSTNDTYRIASVSSGFFDKANVVRSQNMNVTANVRDNRSRTATVTFTLTASDSMRPTIRYVMPTIVQPSPAIDTFPNTYIASVSRVKVSVGFSLNTQAKISNATLQYSGSLPITMRVNSGTGVCEATTTNPITGETDFTATLTDERGMSTSQTVKLTGVKPYSAPTVTVNSYRRCNADKTPNDSGEYCLMNVSYEITPLDNQNAKTAKVNSTAYTDTRDLEDYTQTVEYLFAANMERSYEITVIAIDAITQASKTVRLSTAGAIMDFLTGGKGIGLGKVAEYQNMVEVNPEWEFKCRVRVNGQLVDLGTILETLLSQS